MFEAAEGGALAALLEVADPSDHEAVAATFWSQIEGSVNPGYKLKLVALFFAGFVLLEYLVCWTIWCLPKNRFQNKPRTEQRTKIDKNGKEKKFTLRIGGTHQFAECVILCLFDVIVIMYYMPIYFEEPGSPLPVDQAVHGSEPNDIYGYNPIVQVLTLFCCAMEAWNLWHCLLFDMKFEAGFVAHHIFSSLVSWYGSIPFMQYYGGFFFGVCMISSLFCNSWYIFKYFPSLKEDYPTTEKIWKLIFGILFMAIRSVWWFVVCIPWQIKTWSLLGDPKETAGLPAVLSFLIGNTVLCYLQILWTVPIFNGAKEALFPRASSSAQKKQK